MEVAAQLDLFIQRLERENERHREKIKGLGEKLSHDQINAHYHFSRSGNDVMWAAASLYANERTIQTIEALKAKGQTAERIVLDLVHSLDREVLTKAASANNGSSCPISTQNDRHFTAAIAEIARDVRRVWMPDTL